ncbi:hypothetical protein Pcinc_009179 [Petrolisthes cinctipes]|uniref:Uncharacterized protein n=1 Tax=Petrolisthes cinctipes TaxID=88211 RepID=A0AAE1G357_PETCI|nr:hypothetical protein Pcinc_013679 [Petrolisthes cinctipes]KAK3885539.1 hypothetical protein Pcinc_010280 [Petrolisthes cinctipes]KAK3886662.1 hypothetical protein Pcinc_009179 [Petrolisthes cinctipes]
MFHAFSGCDTNSAAGGKGKKSSWQAWQGYEDVTETFVYLQLLDAADEHFKKVEIDCHIVRQNQPIEFSQRLRRELCCQKNRTMDKLPPTMDAILQHVRRSVRQGEILTTSRQTQ